MGMSKERLIFDTTAAADSDNVGAFIRTTSGIISSQLIDGKQNLHMHATTARPEDSAHASGSMGEFVLAVRNDAGTPLAADGDYIPLTTDSTGAMRVTGGGGGVEFAEDSAHASGNTGKFQLSVRVDDVPAGANGAFLAGLEGDYQAFLTDAAGRLWVTGTFNEDQASASGHPGHSNLSVRQDTLASSTTTDGDYAHMKSDSLGALYVNVQADPTADDAVDAGNPVKVGSRVVGGVLTAIADADRANVISDTFRRVWVNNAPNVSVAQTQRTISGVLSALPATNLTGRTRIVIQNASTGAANSVYIGGAGTTSANGTRLSAGAVVTLEIGDDVTLSGISGGSADIRILELA